jgi:hypothetical protein
MIKTLNTRVVGSIMREVDAVPVWRILAPEEYFQPGARWTVPVWVIRDWVAESLRKGDYRAAGLWSAALGRETYPAPVPTSPTVTICDRHLQSRVPTPRPGRSSVTLDASLRGRMRNSQLLFRAGIAGPGWRTVLPLV